MRIIKTVLAICIGLLIGNVNANLDSDYKESHKIEKQDNHGFQSDRSGLFKAYQKQTSKKEQIRANEDVSISEE